MIRCSDVIGRNQIHNIIRNHHLHHRWQESSSLVSSNGDRRITASVTHVTWAPWHSLVCARVVMRHLFLPRSAVAIRFGALKNYISAWHLMLKSQWNAKLKPFSSRNMTGFSDPTKVYLGNTHGQYREYLMEPLRDTERQNYKGRRVTLINWMLNTLFGNVTKVVSS